MTTFASCEMVYHHTKKNARFFNWCVGHFYIGGAEPHPDYPGVEAYLWCKLPALDGRWDGSACALPISRHNWVSGSKPATWAWDGNHEKPTLTPSVFHDPNQPTSRHHWHGWITAGRMVGC